MPFPSLQQINSVPLNLFVFGPGFGESLLLRTPEGSWVAIDSATRQREGHAVNPTLAALDQYNAELDVVLLTHPHEDHVKGLRDLIERCGREATVAAVEPLMRTPSSYAVATEVDDVAALTAGPAIAAHVAIDRTWSVGRRRWAISAGSSIDVGGCSLEVLIPGADALDEFASGVAFDLNDLSAAVRVRWPNGGDLVLGADATAIAWDEASSRLVPENLLGCRPVKVPHHGSKRAIHRLLFDEENPSPDRPLVATPWSKGTGLPRFDPGEGVDRLLRTAGSLQLTSFPFASLDVSVPISTNEAFESLRTIEVDDDADADTLAIQLDQPSAVDSDNGALDAWVLVQADAAGGFAVQRGTSALEVVP
jgi:beta-lactamase superfamily II metal-dependent hydrolase